MRLRAPGLLAFLLTPPGQITPLPSPTPALQLAAESSHHPPATGLSLTRLQSIDPEGARSAQRFQSPGRTAQCALALEGRKKWDAEARLIYRDVPTPGVPNRGRRLRGREARASGKRRELRPERRGAGSRPAALPASVGEGDVGPALQVSPGSLSSFSNEDS